VILVLAGLDRNAHVTSMSGERPPFVVLQPSTACDCENPLLQRDDDARMKRRIEGSGQPPCQLAVGAGPRSRAGGI